MEGEEIKSRKGGQRGEKWTGGSEGTRRERGTKEEKKRGGNWGKQDRKMIHGKRKSGKRGERGEERDMGEATKTYAFKCCLFVFASRRVAIALAIAKLQKYGLYR